MSLDYARTLIFDKRRAYDDPCHIYGERTKILRCCRYAHMVVVSTCGTAASAAEKPLQVPKTAPGYESRGLSTAVK